MLSNLGKKLSEHLQDDLKTARILFLGELTIEFVSPSVKRLLGYETLDLIGVSRMT